MLAFGMQAALLLKALSYDANISRFARIDIAVVYSSGDQGTADGFLDAFGSMRNKTVKGIPVTARRVSLGSDLSEYEVVYICSDNEATIRRVLGASKGKITVSPYPKAVRSGAVLAFGQAGGRPKIYVNLSASRRAGCRFSSDFLRLVEVVE